MSRPRRIASGIATAVITHQPFSAGQEQQSLHITITMPSNKLRQLTSGGHNVTKGRTVSGNGRDQFVAGEIVEGKRARVVKKSYVLESDSDEEDDEEDDEMEDVGDDDAEGESIDDDEDVEEDAEGDVDMDIPPPAPTIKISKPNNSKPVISVKPTGKSDGRTVEQKEASDDELSELESELGEEGMQLGDEDDAEGDEEEIEVEDDEDDDLDSDDETPGDGSRASTPDLTKLTKRQRARLEEGGSGHLLALPDEVQTKKHLTAEEHAMRRAEMARRRKNLSEKRNEEEKMETINKLLKKQAPKTNARRKDYNGLEELAEGEFRKANPIFTRWISNKDGNSVSVPEEWVSGPAGAIFVGGGNRSGKLIEEVN